MTNKEVWLLCWLAVTTETRTEPGVHGNQFAMNILILNELFYIIIKLLLSCFKAVVDRQGIDREGGKKNK